MSAAEAINVILDHVELCLRCQANIDPRRGLTVRRMCPRGKELVDETYAALDRRG